MECGQELALAATATKAVVDKSAEDRAGQTEKRTKLAHWIAGLRAHLDQFPKDAIDGSVCIEATVWAETGKPAVLRFVAHLCGVRLALPIENTSS